MSKAPSAPADILARYLTSGPEWLLGDLPPGDLLAQDISGVTWEMLLVRGVKIRHLRLAITAIAGLNNHPGPWRDLGLDLGRLAIELARMHDRVVHQEAKPEAASNTSRRTVYG